MYGHFRFLFSRMVRFPLKAAPTAFPDGPRLAEAAFFLLVARCGLRLLPFRALTPWLSQRLKGPELTGERRRRRCSDVRRAIRRVARHLPGGAVCFPRAIAAQMMLRRRRIGTELFYGAADLPGQGLMAHVWLQDADEDIVGCRTASRYRVLACYSTRRQVPLD